MIPTGRRTESFADDLNTRRGIVSGRVALLPRSTEIQPFVAPIRPSPLRHTSPKSNFVDVRPEVRSERPPEAARLGFPLRCPGETCSFPPNASSHCMPGPRTRGKRWLGGLGGGTSAGFAASAPLLLPRRTKSAAKDSAGAGGPLREAFCPGPGEAAGRAAGRFPPSLCHGLGRNSNEPCGLANFFSKLLVSLLPDLAEYRKLSRNEGTRIQRKELCIIFFLKLTRLLTS